MADDASTRKSRLVDQALRREPFPPRRRGSLSRWISIVFLLLLAALLVWFAWVYGQIHHYATHDQARPADAIAVFGAAEYEGHPSPVLRARLEQALRLYQRGLAPMIVTLGGQGDPEHSEGSVGRDYLIANGVPESHIIAETRSSSTQASAEQLAVIARANGFQNIVAVSDGTHLFRIHELCAKYGLQVYTSPRAAGKPIGFKKRIERVAHEMLSYSLFRLGL